MAAQSHYTSFGVTKDTNHRRSGLEAGESVTVPQSTASAEFLHRTIMTTF
jgi:hypothetical protein